MACDLYVLEHTLSFGARGDRGFDRHARRVIVRPHIRDQSCQAFPIQDAMNQRNSRFVIAPLWWKPDLT
jgi:hypothetical protein